MKVHLRKAVFSCASILAFVGCSTEPPSESVSHTELSLSANEARTQVLVKLPVSALQRSWLKPRPVSSVRKLKTAVVIQLADGQTILRPVSGVALYELPEAKLHKLISFTASHIQNKYAKSQLSEIVQNSAISAAYTELLTKDLVKHGMLDSSLATSQRSTLEELVELLITPAVQLEMARMEATAETIVSDIFHMATDGAFTDSTTRYEQGYTETTTTTMAQGSGGTSTTRTYGVSGENGSKSGDRITTVTDAETGETTRYESDRDTDDDSIPNAVDPDIDNDDIPNDQDTDDDDDGVPDDEDKYPKDGSRSITAESEVWLIAAIENLESHTIQYGANETESVVNIHELMFQLRIPATALATDMLKGNTLAASDTQLEDLSVIQDSGAVFRRAVLFR